MKKLIGIAVAALALAPWTIASAAPPGLSTYLPLTCENGRTITVGLPDSGPQARAFLAQQGLHGRAFTTAIMGTLTVEGTVYPVDVVEGPSQTLVSGKVVPVSAQSLNGTVRCSATEGGEFSFPLEQYDLDLLGLDASYLGAIGTFAGEQAFSVYLGAKQLEHRG